MCIDPSEASNNDLPYPDFRNLRRIDGNPMVTGRDDDHVNLNRHQVELGEIEHVSRTLPGVTDTSVQVRECGSDRLLLTYVVVQRSVDFGALHGQLAPLLPVYMIRALTSAPEQSAGTRMTRHVAPRWTHARRGALGARAGRTRT